MKEGNCSLEKQIIDILVQVKLIFNSAWQVVFDPLFDPGVGTKMGPLPILPFQIIRSISMKLYIR